MVFSKKWLRKRPKFLLHFLIHIGVNVLGSKFEVIPSSIFRVTAIFKMSQNLKIPKAIAHGFFQKMAPKSPQIFITFSDTY